MAGVTGIRAVGFAGAALAAGAALWSSPANAQTSAAGYSLNTPILPTNTYTAPPPLPSQRFDGFGQGVTYSAGGTPTPGTAGPAPVSARADCAADPYACSDPHLFDEDYLAGFYQVPWEMVSRPFDVSTEALIIDAIAIGGFGLLYAVDEDIQEEVIDGRSEDTAEFFDTFEPLGDLYTVLAITGSSYLIGEVADLRSMQRIGLNGTQAVALAAIPVGATKALFGRKRPNKNDGNDAWFDGGNSFLSGHTTYAFTAASVVAHEFVDTGWVPWIAYGTAAMVGAQRIYADKHWASDVFISALVGWGIGQAVYDLDYFSPEGPVNLSGMDSPGAHGVKLSLNW